MTIVEALDSAGVALRSATEPIDTQEPVGRMLLQLLGIFAEFERGLLIGSDGLKWPHLEA